MAPSTTHHPSAPLAGVRILDLGRVVSGPYCTQVLADLGAEVIKVESIPDDEQPTGTLTEIEAFRWGLNRNKWSIAVNQRTPEGQVLIRRLAAESDVVFDNFRPGVMAKLGLDHASLASTVGPAIITCSLSGFGESGPWAKMPAYDPIVQALSGSMNFTRAFEEGGAPVRWGPPIGDLFTGIFCAMGVIAALIERDRTGLGQHVDVAMLDVMLALNTYRVPMAMSFDQEPWPMPFEGGQGTVPFGLFECSDGWIGIGVLDRSWTKFCEVIGKDEWAADERFANHHARQSNRKALVALLQAVFPTRTSEEWQHELLEAGVIAGRVTKVADVFAHPQIIERQMAVEISDEAGRTAVVAGDPLKFADQSTWRAPSRVGADTGAVLSTLLATDSAELSRLADAGIIHVAAPDPGHPRYLPVTRFVPPQPTSQSTLGSPLAGFTVIELDGEEPSKAFAGQMLADLGARVIRTDRPVDQFDDLFPDIERESASRCGLNRGKQSITADLKTDAGRALLHSIARRADVVLDNYRPGVSKRLAVDHATLADITPGIITCSLTGFGHTGPWQRYPAFDIAIQALGGGMSITTDHTSPGVPVRWGNPIGGLTGSMYAVLGILAALRRKAITGEGARLDVSLLDCQASLLSYRVPQAVTLGVDFVPDPRRGGSGSLPFGVFPTADGWFVLGITPQFWATFCEVAGKPEWTNDPLLATEPLRRENQAYLDRVVEAQMRTRTSNEWQALFYEVKIPGAAVLTVRQAFEHPQAVARNMAVRLDDSLHPDGVVVAGQPIKLSGMPSPEYRPAPLPGTDTNAVAREFAGDTDGQGEPGHLDA